MYTSKGLIVSLFVALFYFFLPDISNWSSFHQYGKGYTISFGNSSNNESVPNAVDF